MSGAILVAGTALIIMVVFVIIAAATAGVISTGTRYNEGLVTRAELAERKNQGSHLQTASWWFSEDPTTMALLNDLASCLVQGTDISCEVSEVREKWRARVKADRAAIDARLEAVAKELDARLQRDRAETVAAVPT